ncbi:MAG: DUF4190 domain-containing protein [Planctomycetota bacterium]|nr:DUF4190 domain-containing protein [Planctomycetota bacterium]
MLCPYCSATIPDRALKCRYCGEHVPQTPAYQEESALLDDSLEDLAQEDPPPATPEPPAPRRPRPRSPAAAPPSPIPAFVLGLISIVTCCAILGPVAWGLGVSYLSTCRRRGIPPDGLGVAGLVLGIISTVLGVIVWLLYGIGIIAMLQDVERFPR